MKPPEYIIQGSQDVNSFVCKLFYGDCYVVVKGKHLNTSLRSIQRSLLAFIRGGGNNPAGMYFHLFNHVQANPGGKFKVKDVVDSDSGYILLKTEQEYLDAGRHDHNMLNNNIDAYIPEYNDETKMYGWIDKGAVLNFKKWKKSNRQKEKQ